MAINIGDVTLPENSVCLTAFKTPGTLEDNEDGTYTFTRKGKCPFGKSIACVDCTNFGMNYPDVTEVGVTFPRIVCTSLDLDTLQISKPMKTNIQMRKTLGLEKGFVVFVNWRDISIGTIPLSNEVADAENFNSKNFYVREAIKAKIAERIETGLFYLSFSSN